MITEERKNSLLAIIERSGSIQVETLARKMYMSTSTIRRNLAELEHMDLVKRHRGSVETISQSRNLPVKYRYKENHAAKCRIAEKAAAYLQDDAVVFVDASSTCLHMLPHIVSLKGLTVYTNGLELAALLAENDFTAYTVGGRVIPRSKAMVGEYATAMLEHITFDAFFFSGSGYADGIMTDYSLEEAQLRRFLLKHSRQQYFLCDESKIGKSFHYMLCKADEVTEIITEQSEQ